MRNLKKFLALMMAMLMVFSMAVITTGAAADDGSDYLEAAQNLAALTIMKGDENGNLNLGSGVTRYQAALFFVQALTGNTDVNTWNSQKQSTIFSDVPEYGTAIDYAYNIRLILGRGNGVYGYNDPITYQDMLVMAVRALGYEEENMTYPYGYIVAAQKLELTEEVDLVNFTAELTRGETAQLIWNMLRTEVAFVDPLNGDIVYPGEEDSSMYGMMVDTDFKRQTLLEKSGYASGKVEGKITDYIKAEDEDDVDTVQFMLDEGSSMEIAAADLGITASTPKVSYLGLPATVFVNGDPKDFEASYDIDPDASEMSVVFCSFPTMTTVENLGDAGNIRYVEGTGKTASYIQLGGVKVKTDENVVPLMFGTNGWSEVRLAQITDAFTYTTKDGYDDATNSYGRIAYFTTSDETTEDGKTVITTTTYLCYTPYEFGQYFVRSIKDATASGNANYTTIGRYISATKAEINKDGVKSHFIETLAGTNTQVTSASPSSVSKQSGEKAKSVTLVGESVKSGDFMFFDYNAVDNILTVAENCGTFQTGRLTGTSKNNETVKIGGSNKTFGFKGAFTSNIPGYDAENIENIMGTLEVGKDNVKYIEVDGRVVYAEEYTGATASRKGDYNFVIVTTDSDVLVDLLGLKSASELKYTGAASAGGKQTQGFVLDDNGDIQIAVLNTTSGTWQLATLGRFYADYKPVDDDVTVEQADETTEFEYKDYFDLSVNVGYADIFGSKFSNVEKYIDFANKFGQGGIFALVKQSGSVYDIGTIDNPYAVLYAENGDASSQGSALAFRKTSANTSRITADPDVTPASVMQTNASVTVIIDQNGGIGIRRGVINPSSITNYNYNINGPAYCYSATPNLIVMQSRNTRPTVGFTSAKAWATDGGLSDYYLALPGLSDCEVTVNESGLYKYTTTLTNVYRYRTRAIVQSLSFETDTAPTFDINSDDPALFIVNADGTLHDAMDPRTPNSANAYISHYGDPRQFDDVREAAIAVVWAMMRTQNNSSPNGIMALGADGLTLNSAIDVRYDKDKGHPLFGGPSYNTGYYNNDDNRDEEFQTYDYPPSALYGELTTFDFTGLNHDEYDFDRAVLVRTDGYDEAKAEAWNTYDITYDEENNKVGYAFPMNAGLKEDFSGGPIAGVFDQLILDNASGWDEDVSTILVPRADRDDYVGAMAFQYRISIAIQWATTYSNVDSIRLFAVLAYMKAAPYEDLCDHDMEEIDRQDADCTNAGYVDYACRYCGKTDHEVLDALGHDFTVEVPALAPTCGAPGHTSGKQCSRCDEQQGVTEIPATGQHTWGSENKCEVCGATKED